MIRLLALLILLVTSVSAQTIRETEWGDLVYEIRNLSGLDTRSTDFVAAQNNSARTLVNIDLSRGKVGTYTPRLGYDSVSALPSSFDSIYGMEAVPLSDGRDFLAFAADSTGLGYGGLYRTPYGSDRLDSAIQIWPYWSNQTKTSFSVHRDVVMAVNGMQRAIVYDGVNVGFNPSKSTGEPLIVPIKDTPSDTGYLDGEYRYLVRVWVHSDSGWDTTNVTGLVTQPYNTSSGFRLSDFDLPVTNAKNDAIDSVKVWIYRSDENPGGLDELDTFRLANIYRISESPVTYSSGNLMAIAALDTFTFEDYGREPSLYPVGIKPKVPLYATSDQRSGKFRSGTVTHAYGAPGYLSRTRKKYTDALSRAGAHGVYFGGVRQGDTSGVIYFTTNVDTIFNIESDSSRGLYIETDTTGDSLDAAYSLLLPKPPDRFPWYKKRLYRAHWIQMGRDTTIKFIRYDTTINNGRAGLTYRGELKGPFGGRVIGDTTRGNMTFLLIERKHTKTASSFVVDTIYMSEPALVAELEPGDTTYTDSLRFDHLILYGKPYHRAPAPQRLEQVVVYGNTFIGKWRSRLYISAVDSAGVWGPLDFQVANEGDGDQITAIWPTRTAIRVMKNMSNFNLYDNFTKPEVVGQWGCIAPNSYSPGENSHFYLTEAGVVEEVEGEQLERTYSSKLISSILDNFDNFSIEEKSDAYGEYVPQLHKYFINFGGDSTFVYDRKAQGWAVWMIPMGGGVIYDRETVPTFTPKSSWYFFRRGGRTLYKYGAGNDDNGSAFRVIYESAPILMSYDKKVVGKVGLMGKDFLSNEKLALYLKNEQDGFIDLSDGVGHLFDSLDSRYRGRELYTHSAHSITVRLQAYNQTTTVWTDGSLDGIDLFFRREDPYIWR